jgi:hypothetical protein
LFFNSNPREVQQKQINSLRPKIDSIHAQATIKHLSIYQRGPQPMPGRFCSAGPPKMVATYFGGLFAQIGVVQ